MGTRALSGGRLALLAAAATGVQVGAAIVATRFVVSDVGPATLAFLRYAVGILFLLPILLAARRVRFAARDLLPVALLGIGQFGILIALLNYALQFIDAAQAALLFATFPLLTMALAAALGQERFTARKAGGLALTVVGVGFSLGAGAVTAEISGDAWIGAAAALLSALTGAVCSVFYRPYLQRYPTVQVSAFAMATSVVFLAGLASGEGLFARWPETGPAGWAAILFIGVSSGIGYMLWLYALRHALASNVTAFLSLSPITASIVAAVLLGEPITPGDGLGICCVAFGLWIALWRQAPQSARAAKAA